MRKYQELKQTIINHINDLTWESGERLPTESYFCETFDVSRITVQRAKSELELDGYLERIPGRKGHFIKRRPETTPRSGLVGVTIDDISIPFAASILKGIQDRLRESDLHTVICSGIYDPTSVEEFVVSVQARGCDGFIYTPIMGAGYREKNLRIVDRILSAGLPIVFSDRFIPGEIFDSVSSDNYGATYRMTRTLIEQGRHRILTLRGVECSSLDERWRGYTTAMADAGLEIDPALSLTVDDLSYVSHEQNRQTVAKSFEATMSKIGVFDACLCLNHTSFELLNGYLANRPQEFLESLVVAVYDFQTAGNQRFPFVLHSIVQPTYRVGWEAAGLLVRALQDPDHPTIQMTVKSELVLQPLDSRRHTSPVQPQP